MKTPWGGSRRSTRVLCVGLGLALLCAAPRARAQGVPSSDFDEAVDVELFDYAIGPKSFLTVTDAEVESPKTFSLDLLVTFFTHPLTVYNFDPNDDTVGGERSNVIENVLAGQMVGAYGLTDKLQLGASLPIIFSMSGQGVDRDTGMPSSDSFQATGLGDLLVELKAKLWQNPDDSLAFAGTAGVTAPSSVGSNGGDYLGDNLPTGRLRGAFQWRAPNGKFTAGANLGVILRKPRTIYATDVGQQLTYGVGAAYAATPRLSVLGEVFGRGALPGLDLDTSPTEGSAAVRVGLGHQLSVLVGGGGGLTEGLGSPGLRVFGAVGYAPDFRDSDGDAIANQDDGCPMQAEDRDGFEDADGCPDEDNDKDHRPDIEDKCPNDMEDLDGFEDEDGCPEIDNDKDGVRDGDDRCPNQAEDHKPPFEKDGCPFSADDADSDGVQDSDDQCRICMEDKDGFEDGDGCPELDNDKDGVPDAKDKCPNQAETINGVNDLDGCPDQGGKQLAQLDGNVIKVSGPIDFDAKNKLKSTAAVDQVAAVMLMHAEVARWRIVVAAKKAGSEEATRQNGQHEADAIRDELVAHGMSADRIEALGAVSDKPTVAFAVLEKVPDDQRPGATFDTCPAELRAPEQATPGQ